MGMGASSPSTIRTKDNKTEDHSQLSSRDFIMQLHLRNVSDLGQHSQVFASVSGHLQQVTVACWVPEQHNIHGGMVS